MFASEQIMAKGWGQRSRGFRWQFPMETSPSSTECQSSSHIEGVCSTDFQFQEDQTSIKQNLVTAYKTKLSKNLDSVSYLTGNLVGQPTGASLLPILGAFVADMFSGRYGMIIVSYVLFVAKYYTLMGFEKIQGLLLVLILAWPGSMASSLQPPKMDTRYKDEKQPMVVRVKSLIEQMTLKEKIGQMAQIDLHNITPEILKEYSVGNVISPAGGTPHKDGRATPEEWVDMINNVGLGATRS